MLTRVDVRRIVAMTVLASLTVGCGKDDGTDSPPKLSIPAANETGSPEAEIAGLANPAAIVADPSVLPPVSPPQDLYPEVLITTTLGDLRVRLNAAKAPETVDNFLEDYVKRRFYDGTILHYVESGFIAIGGGYTPELKPKEPRAPIRNEASAELRNRRGTIAMSRQVDYADSATSQFFINLADNEALDHDPEGGDEGYGYCVFGEIIGGQEVLDKISQVKVGEQDGFPNVPVVPIVIQSVERIRK